VTDPNTPGILAAEHVKYVFVHDDVYKEENQPPPALSPAVFRLVKRFPTVRVFELQPSVKPLDLGLLLEQNAAAIGAVEGLDVPQLSESGFGPSSRKGWKSFSDGATLVLNNKDVNLKRIQIVVHFGTLAGTRTVSLVTADGQTAGQASVNSPDIQVTLGPFELPQGTSKLTFQVSPRLGAGQHMLLGPMLIQPLADYSVSLATEK
jgi:hypothetical protein